MTRARELANLGNNTTDLEAINTVYDAGGLTGRNLIINGAMQVAQRSTSTSVGDSATYKTMDRWQIGINGTTAGRATMSQSTDAPTGFGYSMKFDVTTADTSIATGEAFGVLQRIEGQNVQHINKGTSDAKVCTFSFYAKGTAKTYIAEFRDDNSRQVSATFNVTTSWQRFEITVPADTTGTIDNDNTAGFLAIFWLHAGSDFTSGTLNTSWATSTNANRMVGCDSIFDSTSNELFITGVQFELGETATPFEHRSYGDELRRCQRYYQQYLNPPLRGTMSAGSASSRTGMILPVPMRATPSVTFTQTGATSHAALFNGAASYTISSIQASYLADFCIEFDFNLASAPTAATPAALYQSSTLQSKFAVSAEL